MLDLHKIADEYLEGQIGLSEIEKTYNLCLDQSMPISKWAFKYVLNEGRLGLVKLSKYHDKIVEAIKFFKIEEYLKKENFKGYVFVKSTVSCTKENLEYFREIAERYDTKDPSSWLKNLSNEIPLGDIRFFTALNYLEVDIFEIEKLSKRDDFQDALNAVRKLKEEA